MYDHGNAGGGEWVRSLEKRNNRGKGAAEIMELYIQTTTNRTSVGKSDIKQEAKVI